MKRTFEEAMSGDNSARLPSASPSALEPVRKYRFNPTASDDEDQGEDMLDMMAHFLDKKAKSPPPAQPVAADGVELDVLGSVAPLSVPGPGMISPHEGSSENTIPLDINIVKEAPESAPDTQPLQLPEPAPHSLENIDVLINELDRAPNLESVEIPSVSMNMSNDSDFQPVSVPRKLPQWMLSREKAVQAEVEANEARRELKYSVLKERAPSGEQQPVEAPAPPPYQVETDIEKIMKDRYIVFDTETTGFGVNDGVLEIGGVEYQAGVRTGLMFHTFIRSPASIHPEAFAVHGISAEDVAHAPPPFEGVYNFFKWVNKSPLVVHNARFDMRLVRQDLDRYRLGEVLHQQPVFDTLQFYRQHYNRVKYSLNDAAHHFHISLASRTQHTALVDAELLGLVFAEMAKDAAARGARTKETAKQ